MKWRSMCSFSIRQVLYRFLYEHGQIFLMRFEGYQRMHAIECSVIRRDLLVEEQLRSRLSRLRASSRLEEARGRVIAGALYGKRQEESRTRCVARGQSRADNSMKGNGADSHASHAKGRAREMLKRC